MALPELFADASTLGGLAVGLAPVAITKVAMDHESRDGIESRRNDAAYRSAAAVCVAGREVVRDRAGSEIVSVTGARRSRPAAGSRGSHELRCQPVARSVRLQRVEVAYDVPGRGSQDGSS
jgi:hypothetical protein